MTRVIVHIDRLVLNGFSHEDGQSVATGLQRELARAFADREAASALRTMGNVSRLRVNRVRNEHDASPGQVGDNVARGIRAVLKK